MARSIAKSPIQSDSGTVKIFGCRPRHQVRMLVPDRGDPTTKIGLFIVSCTSVAWLGHPSTANETRERIRKPNRSVFLASLIGKRFHNFNLFRLPARRGAARILS